MKRPPRIEPALESSSSPRRRRALSEDERALWESVARQTKPLRKKSRPMKAHAAPADAEAPVPARAATPPKPKPMAKPAKVSRPLPPPVPPLMPLGRRERSQLSRGRKDIEARLDLHGMTQDHAHQALLGFLQRANSAGMTFVLVITGKGRLSGGETERGVLRRQVPQWLNLPEFRALVVGFEEAHVGHGGGGALYVRVRRRTIGFG
jgi:DNA-nicking Smr family endonuclease